MSYGYELRSGILSTYGNSLAQKPRDMQTREKSKPKPDKPILRVKSDE